MATGKIHSPERRGSERNLMSAGGVRIRRVLLAFWYGLREWCGDAAYERYSNASATRNSAGTKLTPSEFYVEQLNRRYSRPSRCC